MKPGGKMKQFDTSTTTTTTDNNVMPSMVVRQQRIQMGTSANQGQPNSKRPDIGGQSNDEQVGTLTAPSTCSLIKAAKEMDRSQAINHNQQQQFDLDGLVLPKRVLYHPVSMAQPIIRDLNRELKFNQIRGKNVLDQKSELKKALEKLGESKRRREAEQERLSRRTSLELRLEERADRIAKQAGPQVYKNSEFDNSSSSAASLVNKQTPLLKSSAASTTTTEAPCKPLSNFSIRSITR